MKSRTRLLLLSPLLLAACQREEREYRAAPAASGTWDTVAPASLLPGATGRKGQDYESNAYHLSQGKRLFSWFNCAGCHAPGGGGDIGPPLIDDQWIYGASIEAIVQTIGEGRPNGMPSFRGRVPEDQIWQLAAYVRAMSGHVPTDAAPTRADHMHSRPAENRMPKSSAVAGAVPPGEHRSR